MTLSLFNRLIPMLGRNFSTLLLVFGTVLLADITKACPFCAAESRTLTEEMNDSSVVLLGRLLAPSAAGEKISTGEVPYGFVDPETGAARFLVEQVLQGKEALGDAKEVEAIYFGDSDQERLYMIRGVGEPPDWAIPLPLSKVAAEYVPKLVELPESGADRMEFFLNYLQHEDPLLSQDAYDEFARAPYQDVIDLADRMDREQLLAWIEDARVSPSRRRLFLTMLGVCGVDSDVDRLESMLTSDGRLLGPAAEAAVAASLVTGGGLGVALLPETIRFSERQRKLGLDAMIACYLTLSGKHRNAAEGLDLVDERFLTDPRADYAHIYAALQALRFLAEEQQELIPLERVLQSAELLLDSPDFADQVIPDLARWEDWSVLERLASMYEQSVSGDRDKYIREPIITYLDVALEQDGTVGERAAAALARVEPLDPAAAKRARSLRAFGFLAQARSKSNNAAVSADEVQKEIAALPAEVTVESWQLAEGEPPVPNGASSESEDASLAETPVAENPPSKTPAAESPIAEKPVTEVTQPANAVDPPELSRWLLVGLPLIAAVACVGIFWTILRGGVA